MRHPFLVLCLLPLPAMGGPLFEDHSSTLPPHEYAGGWNHFVGGGLAVFDCNGDALPELLAAGGDNAMLFLRNEGAMRFAPAPFPEIRQATGAYPLDITGDGILDLYILRAGADQVLAGDGACGFADIGGDLGLPDADRWSTAFSAWWQGADRLPHLFIGHYVNRANPDGPFEACDANTILSPAGETYQARDLAPGFCTLSALAGRDARGRVTLRLSNDRHYYVRGGHEQMWDIEEARFLDEADGWPKISLWGMGIASRDLTGDGRDEVMLTSMGDQLLQIAQEDGTYRPAPYEIGTYAQRPHDGSDGRPSTGWHAQFADIDNDMRPDLFIAKGNVDQMGTNAIHDPNNLLMQNPDGSFAEAASAAGVASAARARGAALADLDLDGLVDLVVVNRRANLELYRNVTPEAGHWIALDLRDTGPNVFAIGAEIWVTANGVTQYLQNLVGGGHAGGQAVPLHFGLGTAEMAEITVAWPDGRRTITRAPANQIITIRP